MNRLDILNKCNENKQKSIAITSNPENKRIIKIMTKTLEKRIDKIHEICSVENYNLCFIGEVGVGKSTAIANLLGFVDPLKFKVGNKLTEVPLLKTGEGRTTLCETEISFLDEDNCKTRIEITALDSLAFEKLVNDFCLKNIKSEVDNNSESDIKCPAEVQRAIKNMSGFNLKDSDAQIKYIKDTLKITEVQDDKLQELAKEAILKRINYPARNCTTLHYESENLETWLKESFAKINDGEISTVPYPVAIKIIIPKTQWRIDIPNIIKNIKDTRGIDGTAAREDIVEVIKDKSNICIICDNIKNYGNIVSETFIKNHFTPQNHDLKFRNFVVGLEQGGQLGKVNGADGRENGKDIKKEEAISNWTDISLDGFNMIFYNSFLGIRFDSDYEILNIDEKLYKEEQDSILKVIESKVNSMYENYNLELREINKELHAFSENKVESTHLEKLMKFQGYIKSCCLQLTENYSLFFDKLEKEVRTQAHSGHIRGSVNNKGKYMNYDLYIQAKNFSYEEFDSTTKKFIYYLQQQCNLIFDDNDAMESALKKAIHYQIDDLFNKHRANNALDYEEVLLEKIYDDPIWNEMARYWGNKIYGYKYRDRIADTLFEAIKAKRFVDEIKARQNTAKFFRDLDLFFEFKPVVH